MTATTKVAMLTIETIIDDSNDDYNEKKPRRPLRR